MRVLGISGSLRGDSHNSKLLRTAAELLPSGVELEVYEDLKSIPPYDADDEQFVAASVSELREAIAEADAVLVATPEYNASIPGVLKNALDWVSRPHATNALRGKPAAVVGASTGMFGGVWAQAETRKVLQTIGARVVDGELPVSEADERFDAEGRLDDDDLREVLAEILAELADAVDARRAAPRSSGWPSRPRTRPARSLRAA
jgi:chromate reductase